MVFPHHPLGFQNYQVGADGSSGLLVAGLVGALLLTMAFLAWSLSARKKAIQQAEQCQLSEQRYRSSVETAPYAVILHNGTRIIYANPTAAHLIGAKSATDLLDKNIRDFIPKENWGLVEARRARVLAGEQNIYPVRDEYLRLDGSTVPVEVTINIFKHNGEHLAQVTAIDISKHTENEKSLLSQSNYLRLLNEITAIAAGVSQFEDMLQALANRLGELFEAEGCYITLWDAETQTTIPAAAYAEMSADYPRKHAVNSKQTMTAAVLHAERALIAEDVHNSPHIDPSIAAQFPPHSLLGLPLIASQQQLGAALIAFEPGHEFSDEEITRGEQAAAQIALAISKAQSYARARQSAKALAQRNKELSILYQASQVIGSTLTLEDVFNEVVQIISAAVAPSGCAISLWQQEKGYIETRLDYSPNEPDHVDRSGEIYYLKEYPATRQVLESGQPTILQRDDPEIDASERAFMEQENLKTVLLLPLLTGQRVLGLIELYEKTTARQYHTEEIQLAQSLCTHATSAIENARLLENFQNLTNDLEQRVAERTGELELRVTEVEQLNSAMSNLLEDVQTANHILEITTQQLQEANEELESFSYSVSHDLRAPLRHINAFTQLLLDRDHANLDTTALRFLDNIAASSKRMSQLIDDLLKFSRTSRAEMERRPIDFNDLLQKLINEMEFDLQQRPIDWEIHDLPTVQADAALMRVVWANLLSNAIKYTALEQHTHIEIGARHDDASTFVTFFIRDNGVGFDTKYADKLFGVFQRLHQRAEFEGTGIGLATVRRVIHRHGGRVWAESELGEGATFYFSLPTEIN